MKNTTLLEKKFEQMGAKVEIEELESTRFTSQRNKASPTFDVQTDKKKGEVFKIRIGKDSPASIEVIDIQPKDRHMLVLVRQPERVIQLPQDVHGLLVGDGPNEHKLPASKSKFLMGHDERHWFVAAVPEESSASNVQTAKEALQPVEVEEALLGQKMKRKDRTKRKNKAFKRQGEWFFIPAPKSFIPDEDLVLKNEPLSRGRGSKPHNMEWAYRHGGIAVYVNNQHPNGLTQSQFETLPLEQQRGSGVFWNKMVRNAVVYAKGKISHSDHAPLVLDGWHRVVTNTENKAHAMSQVVFLD